VIYIPSFVEIGSGIQKLIGALKYEVAWTDSSSGPVVGLCE
jgi:hypothetical protein